MLIIAHRKMSQQLWSPGGACRRPSFARAFRYAGPVVAVAGSTSTRCFIFSDEIRRERRQGSRRCMSGDGCLPLVLDVMYSVLNVDLALCDSSHGPGRKVKLGACSVLPALLMNGYYE